MPAIDAWVVAQAAGLVATGRRVHFNLSGHSINDAVVNRALVDAVSHADVDPGLMTVELTETALIDGTDNVRDFVARLRDLGYTVALDDFGTGYNSFARVRDIPVDELKIDMSFVQDMLGNCASESVSRAIVNLAADLGVRTVAEGVEDPARPTSSANSA
jgi:EAL domain-containing protein (putative c-di-GMP-specific phosphodiesterase class I)